MLSGFYLLALPCIAVGVVVAVLTQEPPEVDSKQPPTDGSAAGPSDLVQRYLFDVVQAGDLAKTREIFSHSHGYSDPDGSPFSSGPAGMSEIAAMLRAAIPEPRVSITRILVEDDIVSVSFRVSGDLHDSSRTTSVGLHWQFRVMARQVVSTLGNVALMSRLEWMLPEREATLETDTAQIPLPPRSRPRSATGRRRIWFE